MGREVKRVPLDFDWPIADIWPPYMAGICTEEVRYCVGKDKTDDEVCDACRHAARLVGREISSSCNCPNWKIDPPKGDGWQMWEDVSEGSPISPVCESAEALAKWLADNGSSASGSMTATYDQWLNTIKRGWATSLVIENGSVKSGVEAG